MGELANVATQHGLIWTRKSEAEFKTHWFGFSGLKSRHLSTIDQKWQFYYSLFQMERLSHSCMAISHGTETDMLQGVPRTFWYFAAAPPFDVKTASNTTPPKMADTDQQSPPRQLGPAQFLMSNKLETAMWLSRLFTVYCSIMFILPILGPHAAANFYQRALLANALTSALRLHQRLPHFQLSRAFLAQALQEDSCHYLLYSLILVNSYPITMSIFPVFLFSLLHATTYTKKVLDSVGPNSLMFIRNLLDKLTANQQNILKFIACNEIFLMPATVFMLFSGQGSLLLPFIYYRFLTLRYTSRRNPYCRTLFTELRILLEHFIMKPACPIFFRRMCLSSIAFISRLAPTGVWSSRLRKFLLFSLFCFFLFFSPHTT